MIVICGILGYSGAKPVNEDNIKILFLYSQTRGIHATGYATLNDIKKGNVSSPFFIARNPIPETNLIIGHTRNPSTTQQDGEHNAQPFVFDNIIGVHNGYINNYYQLKTKMENEDKFSDSYQALSAIDKYGYKGIGECKGNMAFAWINKETQELNLYRHSKPIFTGIIDGGMYFASEKDFLSAIDCEDIKEIAEDTHISIINGEVKETHSIEPMKYNNYGFNRQKSDVKSSYGGNHITNYIDNEREANSVIKLKSIKAPKDSKPMWHNGVMNYYWMEDNVLFVEKINSATSTEQFSYDLGFETSYSEAQKEFKPIVEAVSK